MEFEFAGNNGLKLGGLIVLCLLILAEAFWLIFRRKASYPWDHALTSLGVNLIKRVIDVATAGIAIGLVMWAYSHRIATIEIDSVAMVFLLILAVEFAYYWNHRLSHEIRWMWATHAVHHTSPHMNFSAAVRLGWTNLISGSILFFLPLAWLGFHPIPVFIVLALGLFYQLFLHTELVPRLGWIEYVLNTPSNHRVHHGSNPEYLDKNHGGILMIYDVLFGTYQAERQDIEIRYGTVKPMESRNPFVVGLFEWGRMIEDVKIARSWREALGYMFGRPGWTPTGQHDADIELQSAETVQP
ncbi:MAG: sterol desaturase family protein [Pseudomonadota bacterium]